MKDVPKAIEAVWKIESNRALAEEALGDKVVIREPLRITAA